jgi:mRNA interferase HigB
MKIISLKHLSDFSTKHPETSVQLERWAAAVRAGDWNSMDAVSRAFSKCMALNGERVRFEVCGGDYRLIVAFDFRRQWVFVKFIGTPADYDRIDALTVSLF